MDEILAKRGELQDREIALKNAATTGSLSPGALAQGWINLSLDQAALSGRTDAALKAAVSAAKQSEVWLREKTQENMRRLKSEMARDEQRRVIQEAANVYLEGHRFLSLKAPTVQVYGTRLAARIKAIGKDLGYVWLDAEHDGSTVGCLVMRPEKGVHYSIGQEITVFLVHVRNMVHHLHDDTTSPPSGFYVWVDTDAERALAVGDEFSAEVLQGHKTSSLLRIEFEAGRYIDRTVAHGEQRALFGQQNKKGRVTRVVLDRISPEEGAGFRTHYRLAPGARFK